MSINKGGLITGMGPGASTHSAIPRTGMLATVRNRRGIVASVEPFDGGVEGRVHLVTIEYLDAESPMQEQLIWEREIKPHVLEPSALPDVSGSPPMPPDELAALERAVRWTSLSRFDSDSETGESPDMISAPFHAAVQVDDFQMVPVLKAIRMPRVALLLADDVGLGKTVEAGLILVELLLRRRIRRVLILCPASLRMQWKQEMRDKFSLSFDLVDRRSTHLLQRQLGLDANPWRMYPRIIASYDYLKQPDILEQFRAACRMPEGSPHLPWDLLIVDEVHNLTPAPIGQESDLARMLRLIAPYFEHKLFLTATPHNGHTRSLTGLLECLDPVRFTQKSDHISEAERRRMEQVIVRRMKSDINARSKPPRFSERRLQSVPLTLSPEEQALSLAFSRFRASMHGIMSGSGRADRRAANFAIEVLNKRLLSCPATFADSWYRYKIGIEQSEPASREDVEGSRRALREDTGDDLETEAREALAAETVGAWLKPLIKHLSAEMSVVDNALGNLGLGPTQGPAWTPKRDSRFEALVRLVQSTLLEPGSPQGQPRWKPDERLVVFTEYKTTMDYIRRRLGDAFRDPGVIMTLYGGMDESEREKIKSAFNDPSAPGRILVATDAAAEGLNLQQTARYLLHYDVPWNPARLEQRNGRLDRFGQSRDVYVFHFVTDDDADLAFLAYVVGKVNTIREDLGSIGQLFDDALERRLVSGEDSRRVQSELDARIQVLGGKSDLPRAEDSELGARALHGFRRLCREVGYGPETLRDTLDTAMGLESGRPRLEPDSAGLYRLRSPVPSSWAAVVDNSLRPGDQTMKGPISAITFDPDALIADVGGRRIFRSQNGAALLHLGHPMVQQAIHVLARKRFPGDGSASRWTVTRGDIPAGLDAVIILSMEELAVNELRETFHHWVRTLYIPVRRGEIGQPLGDLELTGSCRKSPATKCVQRAREIWDEVYPEIRKLVSESARRLTADLSARLNRHRDEAIVRENERFQSRQGEVSALIAETTIARLEDEIRQLKQRRNQGQLFDQEAYLEEIDRSISEKELEIKRRRAHYEELREQLSLERQRVLQHIVPKRYALRGNAQVFPLCVEIRLPVESR